MLSSSAASLKLGESSANSIPEDFYCPVSYMIMREPVLASDGIHYEKDYIELALKTSDNSPMKGQGVKITGFFHDQRLQTTINKFIENHPELITPSDEKQASDVYIPMSYWQDLHQAIDKDNVSRFRDMIKKDKRLLTLNPRESQTVGALQLPDFNAIQLAMNNFSSNILETIEKLTANESDQFLLASNTECKDKVLLLSIQNGKVEKLREVKLTKEKFLSLTQDKSVSKKHISDEVRFNPLRYLIKRNAKNFTEVASFLLEEKLVSVPRANWASTPLTHLAVSLDNLDALKLLQLHGTPINEVTSDGVTTLHIAAYYQSINCMNYLLENGAKESINAKTMHGRTPIFYACLSTCTSNGTVEKEYELASLLITHGADCRVADKDFITPLHFVVNPLTVDLFIEKGALVDAVSRWGTTPLEDCLLIDRRFHMGLELINTLLKHGANPNGASHRYNYSTLIKLFRISDGQAAAVILLLINAGANLKVVEESHGQCETLLGLWGYKCRDESVLRVLLDKGCTQWTKSHDPVDFTLSGYDLLEKTLRDQQQTITRITSEEAKRIAIASVPVIEADEVKAAAQNPTRQPVSGYSFTTVMNRIAATFQPNQSSPNNESSEQIKSPSQGK